MEISSTVAQTTATTTTTPESTQSVISSDFETFLVMLTAQLENQDPLNPLDSQDFATQLATFSGVEQQAQTNDLLRGLSADLVTSSLGDKAGWVGLDARVEGPIAFNGTPIELQASMPTLADRAELTVRNSAGQIVQSVSVPVSDEPILWAGVDDGGNPLPNDVYSFSIASIQQDEIIDEDTPHGFVKVAEVRNVDGTVMIADESGNFYRAESVLGLR